MYCAITVFAVWQVLCKTRKHLDKSTSPVSAGPTAAVPTAPVPTPKRPSLFKKEPDVFDFLCLSVHFFIQAVSGTSNAASDA